MSALLITGIPGTGKTEAGDQLARKHNYQHIDVEAFLSTPPPKTFFELLRMVHTAKAEHENVVVTWGFRPLEDGDAIRAIQDMGFRMVWFGGNDFAAHREYSKRNMGKRIPNAQSEMNWAVQMHNIGLMDLDSFAPVRINPFNTRGQFVNREAIIKRLIALG